MPPVPEYLACGVCWFSQTIELEFFDADVVWISLDEVLTLDELDRRCTQRVLALGGGNKSWEADLLGLDRRTLYRRLGRVSGPHERET